MPKGNAEILSDEELSEHQARADGFRSMQFTETEAHLLAAAGADFHDAIELLARGCTHAWAVQILI